LRLRDHSSAKKQQCPYNASRYCRLWCTVTSGLCLCPSVLHTLPLAPLLSLRCVEFHITVSSLPPVSNAYGLPFMKSGSSCSHSQCTPFLGDHHHYHLPATGPCCGPGVPSMAEDHSLAGTSASCPNPSLGAVPVIQMPNALLKYACMDGIPTVASKWHCRCHT